MYGNSMLLSGESLWVSSPWAFPFNMQHLQIQNHCVCAALLQTLPSTHISSCYKLVIGCNMVPSTFQSCVFFVVVCFLMTVALKNALALLLLLFSSTSWLFFRYNSFMISWMFDQLFFLCSRTHPCQVPFSELRYCSVFAVVKSAFPTRIQVPAGTDDVHWEKTVTIPGHTSETS